MLCAFLTLKLNAVVASWSGQATDIELGFPAEHIIGYWKQKEEKKFARRMNNSRKPPPDYVTVREGREQATCSDR